MSSGASARTIQVGNAASTAVKLDAQAVTLTSVAGQTSRELNLLKTERNRRKNE